MPISVINGGPIAYDDVVGLLDALGIQQAALVGCSFGGAVAAALLEFLEACERDRA